MLARNGSAGVASSSERVVGASGLSSSGTRKVDVVLVGESEKVGLSVCVCPFYQVFESKFVYAIGADIDSTSRAAKLHVRGRYLGSGERHQFANIRPTVRGFP